MVWLAVAEGHLWTVLLCACSCWVGLGVFYMQRKRGESRQTDRQTRQRETERERDRERKIHTNSTHILRCNVDTWHWRYGFTDSLGSIGCR